MSTKAKLETSPKQKTTAVHVAEVIRHSGPIALPDTMTVEKAIEVLQLRAEYDNKKVIIQETIDVFPWDGAIALSQALTEQFGMALQESDWHPLFGEMPPHQVEVEVGPGETVKVPWGNFSLPGIKGKVSTGVGRSEGRFLFQMSAETTHFSEKRIRKLFERTRELALATSVYRYKAFSIQFNDSDGDALGLPVIKFLQLTDTPCVFNDDLTEAIDTNVLSLIRYTDSVRNAGTPIKRGVLLAGEYGTGKTLAAATIARECLANNWTFIYVRDIAELPQAINFSTIYQPAVIFGEDIDRAAGTERTNDVNTILNTLDGIGNKCLEVMVVLTSNHASNINEAMRRPGRIDSIIKVEMPNADAVQRLFMLFGEQSIEATTNLEPAANLLAGQKPAVIREAVERAKLSAISRSDGMSSLIIGSDLEATARMMLKEQAMFRNPPPPSDPAVAYSADLANRMALQLTPNLEQALERIADRM